MCSLAAAQAVLPLGCCARSAVAAGLALLRWRLLAPAAVGLAAAWPSQDAAVLPGSSAVRPALVCSARLAVAACQSQDAAVLLRSSAAPPVLVCSARPAVAALLLLAQSEERSAVAVELLTSSAWPASAAVLALAGLPRSSAVRIQVLVRSACPVVAAAPGLAQAALLLAWLQESPAEATLEHQGTPPAEGA